MLRNTEYIRNFEEEYKSLMDSAGEFKEEEAVNQVFTNESFVGGGPVFRTYEE